MRRNPQRVHEEELVRAALHGLMGDSLKQAEFCYCGKKKMMLVTYEDYKPETVVKPEVMEAVGRDWKVVVKREFSDLTVMLTMLRLYKENRIAIVDVEDGELRPYQVRAYVNRLMEMQ